jgi:hypothetical protein
VYGSVKVRQSLYLTEAKGIGQNKPIPEPKRTEISVAFYLEQLKHWKARKPNE